MLLIGVASLQIATGENFNVLTPATVNHIAFGLIGLVVMITITYVPNEMLKAVAPSGYVFSLVLLALVILVGDESFGAKRWLRLGPLSFQPMELAKISTILMIAFIGSRYRPALIPLCLVLIITGIPTLMILLQPDLGSTLVLTFSCILTIFAWGMPWKTVIAFVLLAVGLLPVAASIIPSYQLDRIATFIDPSRDPLGSGYTAKQIDIALNGSGFWGNGFFSESQALAGISVRNSDFVFAQWLEATGAFGGILVCGLIILIVSRGITTATKQNVIFNQLVILGLTSLFAIQSLVHIGVNTRFIPTTGITLPLISAGGSSVISVFILIGLLQSMNRLRYEYS
ncbi:MAG: FtsW/RodA/SpoVE family cell cycle protein [Dehalococcoidia bacterium]|nr:FtsW/RodA/SpoVE family cell cycle protein [Dehalococcoidia bacterium]